MAKKEWKSRKEACISEIEDIWNNNWNLEIAKSMLIALRDMSKISLEEKVGFLTYIARQAMYSPDGIDAYLFGPILETSLFILPEWKEEFSEFSKLIIGATTHRPIRESAEFSRGKVKTFIRSYLNTKKKEELDESWATEVLVHNGMFEELINYNFVSDKAICKLWNLLFTRSGNYSDEYDKFFYSPSKFVCIRARKLLLSWDKVENRHALATLHTLLAKRGDLQKIFEIE